MTPAQLVRDLTVVLRHVDRRWKGNRCTMGVKGAAEQVRQAADIDALQRVLDYLQFDDEALPLSRRTVRAADDLRSALDDIAGHRAAIVAQLGAA
jgi:hypothetical protein